MTDPVLSQLVSVESDLAEQIEQLEGQLTHLQTKRQGLLTVIDLFGENSDTLTETTAKSEKAATASTANGRQASSKAKTKSASSSKIAKAATRGTTKGTTKTSTKATTTKTTKTKAKSGRKPKQQTPGRKKKDGRAASWQKHVQAEYRDLALPESVSSVLRSQPSEIFTIADVMTDIFKEDMPRTAYLKARNRISNILSAGARDGTWYRGRNGRYSQSEKVTKIK
ncbi:MAG: hypothetical protein ACFB16_18155 [Phormidesmis sp.]